eukprot:361504-Pelagomonas_calceolata.AAC.3
MHCVEQLPALLLLVTTVGLQQTKQGRGATTPVSTQKEVKKKGLAYLDSFTMSALLASGLAQGAAASAAARPQKLAASKVMSINAASI